jgi:hypothetical protein
MVEPTPDTAAAAAAALVVLYFESHGGITSCIDVAPPLPLLVASCISSFPSPPLRSSKPEAFVVDTRGDVLDDFAAALVEIVSGGTVPPSSVSVA